MFHKGEYVTRRWRKSSWNSFIQGHITWQAWKSCVKIFTHQINNFSIIGPRCKEYFIDRFPIQLNLQLLWDCWATRMQWDEWDFWKKILSKHSSHNPVCGTKKSEAAMHHLHLCVLYRHFPGEKQMALALSKAEPGKLTWVFTCLTINWSLLPHSLILKTGPNFSEIIKTCFQSARNSVKNHHMKKFSTLCKHRFYFGFQQPFKVFRCLQWRIGGRMQESSDHSEECVDIFVGMAHWKMMMAGFLEIISGY